MNESIMQVNKEIGNALEACSGIVIDDAKMIEILEDMKINKTVDMGCCNIHVGVNTRYGGEIILIANAISDRHYAIGSGVSRYGTDCTCSTGSYPPSIRLVK